MILLFPDSFMITKWLKVKRIKAFMRWNKKNYPDDCIFVRYLLIRVYSENFGL